MSKRRDAVLQDLQRILIKMEKELAEMEGRIDFSNNETDPEAYRRWYLSHTMIRNLEDYLNLSHEKIDTYFMDQMTPWWRRIFRRHRGT